MGTVAVYPGTAVHSLARTVAVCGSAAKALARYGQPRKFIFYNGGIGDDLLCTTVARELRGRHSGNIWVGTNRAELFECNPDAHAVPVSDWRLGRLAALLGADVRPLWYTRYDPHGDRDPEPPMHFAAMMCGKAGISGPISIRPYLFLRRAESEQGRVGKNQIAIQSTTRSAATPLQNKEWLPERFQMVADVLSKTHSMVQLGSFGDPRLDGVVDLRGKTSLRQAAAILSQSRLFVGLAGGLMHLARAVDCPAVIVYGGRERARVSGYICNKNLEAMPPCAPCWQRNRCHHGRACMTSIDIVMAVAAAREVLDFAPGELAAERVCI